MMLAKYWAASKRRLRKGEHKRQIIFIGHAFRSTFEKCCITSKHPLLWYSLLEHLRPLRFSVYLFIYLLSSKGRAKRSERHKLLGFVPREECKAPCKGPSPCLLPGQQEAELTRPADHQHPQCWSTPQYQRRCCTVSSQCHWNPLESVTRPHSLPHPTTAHKVLGIFFSTLLSPSRPLLFVSMKAPYTLAYR